MCTRTLAAASLFVLLHLGHPIGAGAQASAAPQPGGSTPSETDLMVTAFLGSATAGFLSVAIQGSGYRGESGWGLRGTFTEEFEIFGPTPTRSVWDVGLLRLSRSAPDVVVRHFGFGAALTGGMNRGARIGHPGGWFGIAIHEEEPFLVPGLIAVAGITIAPLPFFALGATGSGNLNARRPYLAGTVSVSIGSVQ